MGRAILAVIAGFLAMAVFVMVAFSGLYLILGEERSYQPGSFEVSNIWLILAVVISFAAALSGGFVCRLIVKRPRPVHALAVVVAIMGSLEIVGMMFMERDDPLPRTEPVAMFEAASQSHQPTWMTILNPIIGVAGVMIGGRAGGRKSSAVRNE